MYRLLLSTIMIGCCVFLQAQADRWQQRVMYQMDIDFDDSRHQFTGTQQILYTNNSPDELTKVYYHLYYNAFQPGSMMDVRSRTIEDPDGRVGSRIYSLTTTGMGFTQILSLKQNGMPVQFKEEGTILEVTLHTPIAPNSSVLLDMEFKSQVPDQIRRTGKYNKEGIAYSMSQWYPKLCEYDYQGWHANPYVGREFHGVWGDFNVKINIAQNFMVAATGYLQNPEEIGNGYEEAGMKVQKDPRTKKLTWHFYAPNVHDFVWAADPDYTHTKLQAKDGPMMHFFYQKGEKTTDNWETLPKVMDKAFSFINKNYGKYPYKQYSFIQAGDGGMEYPMATLITGERTLGSLVGVSVHELMHSWYQMILGTNESLYAWMDEGFTSYASSEVMDHLKKVKTMPGDPAENTQAGNYGGYYALALSGKEEPMTTHSDHFQTNFAYGRAAYSKGAVYMAQLGYIIGEENLKAGLLKYYDTWKFKHPNSNDFIRIMEKQSGLELDWYKEYWIASTHQINYALIGVTPIDGDKTNISISRVGKMPMPLDIEVTYTNGEKETFYIPLRIMRGEKPATKGQKRTVLGDWPWTHPNYTFSVDVNREKIQSVEIDPAIRMADVDRSNNLISN